MDVASYFVIGQRYPHLAGEYQVRAIEGDWLVCALDDGREIRVTAQNAYRVLEQLGVAGERSEDAHRLEHSCTGRPCGPGCVKNAVSPDNA